MSVAIVLKQRFWGFAGEGDVSGIHQQCGRSLLAVQHWQQICAEWGETAALTLPQGIPFTPVETRRVMLESCVSIHFRQAI
jgi:hypothetical protein